jgi:hypothetical protein
VPVVDGFEVRPWVWIRAGDWIGEAVNALARGPGGVDELCRALGGGQPFGRDDLGRALLEGDSSSGAVGFAGRRDGLLTMLATTVNELQTMAAGLPVSGEGYLKADGAIIETLGGQPVSNVRSPAVDPQVYVLPLPAGGMASTATPPSIWLEAMWILEAVGMGCAYPDGDIGGVQRLISAVAAAKRVVDETAANVERDAEWLIKSGSGPATAQFASTARGVYGEQGMLVDLADRCDHLKGYLQQSADAIRRAQWQCLASAVFVVTLMGFGTILGGWVQLAVLRLVRLEGVWLRIVLRLIREAVLGGVFTGGLDVIGQLFRGTDFDWSELCGALWQGGLAGALIGFAHGGLPALAKRSPAFTVLAALMASSGAKGTVTRLAVSGGVGTVAMATAGWASGHGWDWKHAAEMGFGMAAVGAGGELFGKVFRPVFKPENAPHEFRDPPERIEEWRQQAAADLTWIREVDPGIRKFLDQLAVHGPQDREPRKYLAETREILSFIPQEWRERPEHRPLVKEATNAIARLLWQVDAMYGRTDSPRLHDGTYWRDTPYLYNNGDHTRDVITGSLNYMMDVNGADISAGRTMTYPPHKMVLGALAAAGHDVVQGHSRGVDERAAAAVTDAVAKAYMPQTYTEAYGRYIYNSDLATTFNGKTKTQDVDPARGDIEGQRATAVGDLLHLNLTEKMSRNLDIAVQDFAKPNFYGPEFQHDMREAGLDLNTATTVDYLTVMQHSEKWHARLIQFGEGQLKFLNNQKPPDPRVMEWYPGRERAIQVWTDLLQRLEAGEIDWVTLYHELQQIQAGDGPNAKP